MMIASGYQQLRAPVAPRRQVLSLWHEPCHPSIGRVSAPAPRSAHDAAPKAAVTPVSRRRHRTRPQAVSFEGPIPAGVQVEVKAIGEGPEVEFDQESNTLRLPINVVEGSGERRTKLVIFTCNKCGGRTARNVNPIAWEKGLVMCQCATCEVWHMLSAKNKAIYEEIVYKDDPRYNGTLDGAAAGEAGVQGDGAVGSPPA